MSNKNSVTELWIMSLLTLCSVFLKKKSVGKRPVVCIWFSSSIPRQYCEGGPIWSFFVWLLRSFLIEVEVGDHVWQTRLEAILWWSDLIPVTMIFLHVILQLILNWGPCVTGNTMVVRSDSSRSSCCPAAQGNLTGVPAFLVSGQQIWGKSRSWNY